jgi:hypothetical protein
MNGYEDIANDSPSPALPGYEDIDAPKTQKVSPEPASAKDILARTGKESLSNIESLARGGLTATVAGIPALAGIPGSIEGLYRQQLRGLGANVSEETFLPTMGEIYEPASQIARDVGGAIPFVGERLTDPNERTAGMTQLGEVTLGGVVSPTAALGATSKIKKGVDVLSGARSKQAESAATALQGSLRTRVEDIAAAAAKPKEEALAKLEEIAKAEERLGNRGSALATRSRNLIKDVDSSLNDLSNTRVLSEDLGGIIQPLGKANIESLKGVRTEEAITNIKEPAFEAARIRESRKDFISNNPKSQEEFNEVLTEIQTQIQRTPEPYRSELQRRLASITGKVGQEQKVAIGSGKVSGRVEKTIPAKIEPLTLDNAEFLRRMLNDNKAFEVEGFKAFDAIRQSVLAKKLTSAMNAYEPRIGEYLQEYAKRSAPITKATVGRNRALTETEQLAEEAALFSADKSAATNYFLNGTQERAQRLLDLVGGKTKELTNGIKGYFRNQLEGQTAAQTQKFIKDQEGLLREFPELRDSLNKIYEARNKAEVFSKEIPEKSAAYGQRLTAKSTRARNAVETARDVQESYKKLENELSTLQPKEALSRSEGYINKLYKDGLIDANTHKKYLDEITATVQKYGESAKANELVRAFMRKSLYVGAGGSLASALGGGLYYGLRP